MDEKEIRRVILENSIKHKGKAQVKFVFGAVLKNNPELKKDIKQLKQKLEPIVNEINSISLSKQKQELEKLNPEFFEKKERNIFSFLDIKNGEKVITAFPPSPHKYYHIGHAKAILLNYLLAKKYNGNFYLRFEDTNPKEVLPEFYQVMQDDISFLGVSWDDVYFASDYIDKMIEFAQRLIDKGQAYVCFCNSETQRDLRQKGKPCDCRFNSIDLNKINWDKMKTEFPEKKASLRLKIDMGSKNHRMRDPTIFRIIDFEHPRHGYKFRVYPTYDFQNAVLDGYLNITHRLRTLEFEMASELHHYIRKILNLYDTYTYEFSRFNLEGMLSSGRVIREKIDSKELIGWDDPSLPTLRALKRRGFLSQAIKDLVVESGITKSSGTKLTWDTLIKYNKRLLNNKANRYFFISNDYKEINIENDPKNKYYLKLRPDLKEKREFISNGSYLIEKKDFDSFKDGDLIRLMDNLNFEVKDNKFIFKSTDYFDFKNHNSKSKKIIHFLPNDSSQLVDVSVFTPEHKTIKGKAEKNITSLDKGDIIQFERFGFSKLDSIKLDKDGNKFYNFWFTH